MEKLRVVPGPGSQVEINVGPIYNFAPGYYLLAEYQPTEGCWLTHAGQEGKFFLLSTEHIQLLIIEALIKQCPAKWYDLDHPEGFALCLLAQTL